MSERSFEADVRKIQELADDLLECNQMNAGVFAEQERRIAELEKERDALKLEAQSDETHLKEVLAQYESTRNDCLAFQERAEKAEARIAEFEKERDLWKEKHDSVDAAVGLLHARIADLTKPRVVDEALVRTISDVLCRTAHYDNPSDIARAILAALPPSPEPAELTDEECDQLWGEYGRGCAQGYRGGVRALLAAAGRYVQPVSAGPATDEDLHRLARWYTAWSAKTDFVDEILKERPEVKVILDAREARLPFVGLTKQEAQELREEIGRWSPDCVNTLRILARALGVTE